MKVSVILITHNEERNISACLESVRWADEIVVVDASSSDRTAEFARRFTDKVIVTDWLGYGDAKNFALEHVSNEWVLWIDADERVPVELAAEIRHRITDQSSLLSGYRVARRAYFLGKWIRHCGWYPGYVTRVFRRGLARFTTHGVHERLELAGAIGTLRHDLLHYTDDTLYHYFSKFNRYTTLAAKDVHQAGKRFSMMDITVRPFYMFFKMYFLRLGFLDGMHGLILSLSSAAYVFVKYAKLWEIGFSQSQQPAVHESHSQSP